MIPIKVRAVPFKNLGDGSIMSSLTEKGYLNSVVLLMNAKMGVTITVRVNM